MLRAALRSGEVKHEGRHFSISGVQVTKRVTDIPLMLGGNSERGAAPGGAAGRRLVLVGHAAVRRSRSACATSCSAGGPRRDRADDPFKLVFRMEGADPATARRYADEGFDEVLIWTDQVWPAGQLLEAKREAMFAAAEALGIRASG